jgi:broad specificity phosphatase PhoE
MKNIYFIRHGEATHNVDFKLRGEEAYLDEKHINSVLTTKGINDAIYLKHNFININKIDLVLVSPLTRAIMTVLNIFDNKKIICIEDLREYPMGIHPVNKRKKKSELKSIYKDITFSEICEDDIYFNEGNKESINNLEKRINNLKYYIKKRDEQNIAIISHCSFISYFLYSDFKKILHCKPYVFNLFP